MAKKKRKQDEDGNWIFDPQHIRQAEAIARKNRERIEAAKTSRGTPSGYQSTYRLRKPKESNQ